MKKRYLIIISVLITALLSCSEDGLSDTGMLKGVTGIYEGNCMPFMCSVQCLPSPISTTVAITTPSEFFNIDLLVDSVVSAEDGTFQIDLPAGMYSLFIRDGSEFICDTWSSYEVNYCTLVTIRNDSVTNVLLNIDHASW